MSSYVARRLVLIVPTLIGVTMLIFLLLRVLVPGDVVDVIVGDLVGRDPALEERIRDQYGVGGSIVGQYAEWVGDLATGNLGESYYTGRSVTDELANRLPITIELGFLALLLAWAIGVPIGILAAIRQDSILDYLFRGPSILFLAIPNFWLALLVLTFGARWFDWVPPVRYEDAWDAPRAHFELMAPAALVLGASLSAAVMRFTRAAMLEVLRQDYVRTARSKGLAERTVLLRHGLRNASVPLITLLGGEIAVIIGGTVIIETIFNIPGMGRYFVDSLNFRDYPVVQGVTLLLALIVMGVNLVVDLSYAYLDPRIRYT